MCIALSHGWWQSVSPAQKAVGHSACLQPGCSFRRAKAHSEGLLETDTAMAHSEDQLGTDTAKVRLAGLQEMLVLSSWCLFTGSILLVRLNALLKQDLGSPRLSE